MKANNKQQFQQHFAPNKVCLDEEVCVFFRMHGTLILKNHLLIHTELLNSKKIPGEILLLPLCLTTIMCSV